MFFEGWKGTSQTLLWSKNSFFFFSEWELLKSEARSSIASINDLPHHCRGGDLMSGFVGCASLSVVSYLASR